MARLDDLEHVNRELEAFRAQAKEALKTFDELEKVVSEFSELKQACESIQKSASEKVGILDRYTTEVKQTWSVLENETRTTLKRLNNAEAELCQRFDKLQQDTEQRWTKIQEDILGIQNDLQTANHNLRTELLRKAHDLHGESEQRFSEVNKRLDEQASRHEEAIQGLEAHIGEVHDALVADLETSRQEYRESFGKFELRLTALESRIMVMQRHIFWMTIAQVVLVIVLIILFLFL